MVSSPASRPHGGLRLARWSIACCATALTLGVVPAPALGTTAGQHRPPASIGSTSAPGHPLLAALHYAMKCARPAHEVRFKKDRAVVAVAVGMAESYCRKHAVGHNPPTSGCPHGSDDRGLWQINSCYHPEVKDHCAFDPTCNARATKHISDRGRDWTPWSAYNSGAYRQYLDVAQHAVHRAWRAKAADIATPTLSTQRRSLGVRTARADRVRT